MTVNREAIPAFDYQDRFERDCQYAADTFMKRGKLPPVFMLHTPTSMVVLPLSWGNVAEKMRCLTLVRTSIVAFEAVAVTVAAEAWVSLISDTPDVPRDSQGRPLPKVAPSEDVNRKEVVSVSLSWRGGSLASSREIIRRPNGKVWRLGEAELSAPDSNNGLFVDLLPSGPLPAALVAYARKRLQDFGAKLEVMTVHPAGHA